MKSFTIFPISFNFTDNFFKKIFKNFYTDPTEDFSFLADEDEFEQAEKDLETNQGEADTAGKQGDTIKPLTFADVFF